MPEGAVYVGRGSKWGNPFRGPGAVEKYKAAIRYWPIPPEQKYAWEKACGSMLVQTVLAQRNVFFLKELHGKDLACWCPLDTPCHADVLLEIINGNPT